MSDSTFVSHTITAIQLANLVLASENIRKTPATKSDQDQLEASIEAHGLLENLVVRPVPTKDPDNPQYAVVAGGRRLKALKALEKRKIIPSDFTVPCTLVPEQDGAELSLAENEVRLSLHPADQIVAFTKLSNSGLSIANIAARFGCSERVVEQRLRLGGVAKPIVDAYRAGEIDMRTVEAFSITTDQSRQLAVFEQLEITPSARYHVHGLLTDDRTHATDPVAEFVGIEAYQAAGGKLLTDLFSDDDLSGTWLEDTALVTQLALDKLNEECKKLETQWKWASAHLQYPWDFVGRYSRVHPKKAKPNKREQQTLDTCHKKIHEIQDHLSNGGTHTDKLDRRFDQFRAKIRKINEAVARRDAYSAKDRKLAGCIVSIHTDGSLRIDRGFVLPQDAYEQRSKEQKASDNGNGTSASTNKVVIPSTLDTGPVNPVTKALKDNGMSAVLADDLRCIRTNVVKAKLAKNFAASFDLMTYQLALQIFRDHYHAEVYPLDLRASQTDEHPLGRDRDEDFAAANTGAVALSDLSSLELAWMKEKKAHVRFQKFQALTNKQKQALFTAATARSLKPQLSIEHHAIPAIEQTISKLNINFSKDLRFNSAVFWSRITKSQILEIGKEILGEEWHTTNKLKSKSELAYNMEQIFATKEPFAGIDAKTRAEAHAWVPAGFAADGVSDTDS